MNPLAKRIREAREAKGLSQQALGDLAGYSQQAIDRIESGDTTKPRSWGRIADALDIPKDEFRELMIEANRDAGRSLSSITRATLDRNIDARKEATRLHRNLFALGPRALDLGDKDTMSARLATGTVHLDPEGRPLIPILGRAAAGEPGKIVALDVPVDMALCPPELVGVPGAYSLYVHGESMIPRYYPGERVDVHPYKPVSRGDFVSIQLGDPDLPPEEAYIKEYKGWDDDELVVSQMNPPMELRFPKKRVQSVHLIMGTWRS